MLTARDTDCVSHRPTTTQNLEICVVRHQCTESSPLNSASWQWTTHIANEYTNNQRHLLPIFHKSDKITPMATGTGTNRRTVIAAVVSAALGKSLPALNTA